jgi:glycosyltransferase involved in cell wall biosynthesis
MPARFPMAQPLPSTPAPLFSIVTVVRNNARQLGATIDSLLAQTCPDFELIIVDGASEDNFLEVVGQYQDPRINWHSEPDLGIYDAMNKGIHRARGQIIGTLNAGDYYQPEALALVAQAYHQQGQAELTIAGDIETISKNGFYHRQTSCSGLANWYNKLHQPAFFVTKAVYDRWGTFDPQYRIAGDYDFFLRIYLRVPCVFLGKVLTRTSPAGVSGNLYGATIEAYQARRARYFAPLNWLLTAIKLLRVSLHLLLDRGCAWRWVEGGREWLQRLKFATGER